MDIVVTEVTEHEDGSATLQIDMDNEALTALLQSALLNSIKKGMEMEEKKYEPEQTELFSFGHGVQPL